MLPHSTTGMPLAEVEPTVARSSRRHPQRQGLVESLRPMWPFDVGGGGSARREQEEPGTNSLARRHPTGRTPEAATEREARRRRATEKGLPARPTSTRGGHGLKLVQRRQPEPNLGLIRRAEPSRLAPDPREGRLGAR